MGKSNCPVKDCTLPAVHYHGVCQWLKYGACPHVPPSLARPYISESKVIELEHKVAQLERKLELEVATQEFSRRQMEKDHSAIIAKYEKHVKDHHAPPKRTIFDDMKVLREYAVATGKEPARYRVGVKQRYELNRATTRGQMFCGAATRTDWERGIIGYVEGIPVEESPVADGLVLDASDGKEVRHYVAVWKVDC